MKITYCICEQGRGKQGVVRELFLNEGIVTIGRLNADLIVADTKCSRRHASLTVLSSNEVAIKDLGSLNGTFVGTDRILSRVLKVNDQIVIGHTRLVILKISPNEVAKETESIDVVHSWPEMWGGSPESKRLKGERYF